jgi:predicted PurR-regulated permease PerM
VVPTGLAFTSLVTIAIIVAGLYLTREILVPLALAVLLSFLLAPFIRVLQRWRIPRSIAVVLAILSALTYGSSRAGYHGDDQRQPAR